MEMEKELDKAYTQYFGEIKTLCRNMDLCSWFRNMKTGSMSGNEDILYGSLIDLGHCPSEKVCLKCKEDFELLTVLKESELKEESVQKESQKTQKNESDNSIAQLVHKNV